MRGYLTDPSAAAGLRLAADLPEPEPAPNEALLAVRAYSVNRGETRLVPMRPNAWRPGQDVAGVVVAPAADGSGPRAGTRVVAIVDQAGWSERVAASTDRLAALADNVAFEQAAALPVAGLTALRALRVDGALLGRRVLVTGASGGVGQFAVQLARIAGAHVTALVHGDARAPEARELGAHEVVTSLEAGETRFDLVLDGVGGPLLPAILARCAPRATVAMYAGGGGAQIDLSSFRPAPLAKLMGFFIYADHGTTMAEDLGTLAGYVADGRLRPRLGLVAPWERTHEAFAALHEHRLVGKAVLTLPESAASR